MSDFEPYLRGWRERDARRRDESRLAGERALGVARKLAALLVERYGARRVILVGSLARGDFGTESDIDLAVDGLSPAEFFAAGASLEAAAEGLSVDLVPIESATPLFLERMEREGVALA